MLLYESGNFVLRQTKIVDLNILEDMIFRTLLPIYFQLSFPDIYSLNIFRIDTSSLQTFQIITDFVDNLKILNTISS